MLAACISPRCDLITLVSKGNSTGELFHCRNSNSLSFQDEGNLHFRTRRTEKDCFLCRWRRRGCVKRVPGANVRRAESCGTDNGEKIQQQRTRWKQNTRRSHSRIWCTAGEPDPRDSMNEDDSSTHRSMNFSSLAFSLPTSTLVDDEGHVRALVYLIYNPVRYVVDHN